MRGRLVVGNWKMNGGMARNAALLSALVAGWKAGGDREMAVCVPFPYLAQAKELLAGSAIGWGAQDVSEHASGAYTGEVAADMIAEFGARYALAGHSERRQYHGERDEQVAAKARAALAAGLTPIVCVGETLAEREAGQTEAVVLRQIDAVIRVLGTSLTRTVVAYEPVWAIGTGRNATPAQAQEAHAHIRGRLRSTFGEETAAACRILYGGSVKPDNVKELRAQPDVDGALVGGASLDVNSFHDIVARGR
jgi:triosephosphate isomerase